MKKIFEFIYYFNIHLSIGAGSLWYGSFHFLKNNIESAPLVFIYSCFIICSTFLSYNFICYLSAINSLQKTNKDLYFLKNKNLLFTLSFIVIIIEIYLSFQLNYNDWIFFMSLFLFVFLYERGIKYLKNLRSIPFMKTPVILFVWIMCGVVHPMFLLNKYNIAFIIFVSLLILIVSLVFDEKDKEIDLNSNVKTLANSMEPKHYFILKIILWILASVISFQIFSLQSLWLMICILLFHLYIIFIPKIKSLKENHYFIADLSPLIIGLFLVMI